MSRPKIIVELLEQDLGNEILESDISLESKKNMDVSCGLDMSRPFWMDQMAAGITTSARAAAHPCWALIMWQALAGVLLMCLM